MRWLLFVSLLLIADSVTASIDRFSTKDLDGSWICAIFLPGAYPLVPNACDHLHTTYWASPYLAAHTQPLLYGSLLHSNCEACYSQTPYSYSSLTGEMERFYNACIKRFYTKVFTTASQNKRISLGTWCRVQAFHSATVWISSRFHGSSPTRWLHSVYS